MSAYLLNLCNSTTSIVGFAASAAVLWLASHRPVRPTLVHLAVFSILGLTVIALFFNPGGDMVQSLGKDPTLTGRKVIWDLVLSLHTNPLIGTGFETFWLGSRLEFMRSALPGEIINEAHSGYVEIYLNLGWAGLCFIALLIVTGYKRVTFLIRQDPEKGSLFLAFLLCAIFYSFSEAAFRFNTVSLFFLFLVIIGASQAASLANSRRGGRLIRREEAQISVSNTDQSFTSDPIDELLSEREMTSPNWPVLGKSVWDQS
jgi:exopolysaccharide production protein ExoQ